MTVTYVQHDQALRIHAATYRLVFATGRPHAVLEDADGTRWADLCLVSSLHTRGGLDETASLAPPKVQTLADGGCRLVLETKSSLWQEKRLVFTCHSDVLEAHVEVTGRGALADCYLFGGYYSGQLRWGSGFFESGAHFRSVFNPEPYASERRAIPAAESTAIDVMGTSMPGKRHWFFTPAPFCYAFSQSEAQPDGSVPAGPWLIAGLATPPGQHHFTSFQYQASEGAFSFRLAYEGQSNVDGTFRTPSVVFRIGMPDPYAGLQRHTQDLRDLGYVLPPRVLDRPAWWSEPIFCGWGAQCNLARSVGERAAAGDQAWHAPDYARQEHYDEFLETLASHGLMPGIVVLDDKWQAHYGTCEADLQKWPDLPGWIAARHLAGQHVLLWWKAWDPEGLPPDQCVRNTAEERVAADPSNPAYEATLRQSVRRMLGSRASGGYDADGFKVDFSARTPSGPSLRRHGDEWGVELLHKLLFILYDEAKRVKPDALVMTHTPNPYFATVTDMIRLNDVNTGAPVVPQMRHRARVARAACPELLIDTDNWPMPNRAAWRDYIAIQNELGIPSLYFVTHVDSGEQLEEEDYASLRAVWDQSHPTRIARP